MPSARPAEPETAPPPPETGPGQTDSPPDSWVSRQVDAMAAAWSRGRRVLAAEIIDHNPGIADEAAVRLIFEEVSLRRDAGEDVPTTEVLGRYPRWKAELEVLLGCDRMLRPLAGLAQLPEVGEHLGPFYLRAELGRGASGRTYLASEPTLADRPVVLKVISDDQEEHLSLARLQHTNIIPLFSEHTFPDRGLRALCMPYLGGASLARILESLASIPPADRRGRDIIQVLDRLQDAGAPAPRDGPYRRQIEHVAYVDAICWVGTRLADALQEAHAHGLVHMDVKPSNVLIAADGSPMLLDFHLASRPIAAGERFPERIGGTPGWMAPEHRAAMDAVTSGEPIPEPVDHRADIYALGLLLREALGGQRAGEGPAGSAALRRRNPAVSMGLADIIGRCLAERPAARYPDAACLADDLRCHLEHQPLRGVPNRSPIESLQKLWRRRRSWSLARWAVPASCFALLAALLILWLVGLQRSRDVAGDLQEGRGLCRLGRYADAELALKRGLERATLFPGASQLAASLNDQLRVARRGRRAGDLHHLAEQVRFRYGVEPPTGAEAETLLRNVHTIWQERGPLLARDASPLDDLTETRIREDLLELVAIGAEARIRLATPAELRRAQNDALALIDEAREACGAGFAIDRLGRSLAESLGRVEPGSHVAAVPRTPSDHYDLGRSLLRQGQFERAAEQFRMSLDRRPQDFWPNFYLGLCEYRLGHPAESAAAFSIAIALAPDRAECYFNRAVAADALGRKDQALHDYTRAIECDESLTAARLNRGILSYKERHFSDAVADLRKAISTTTDPGTLGLIYYNLALVHQARGDRASALAAAEQAIARGDDKAHGLRDRLQSER